MKSIVLLFLLLLLPVIAHAQHAQWRGENRDGHFNETGLLQSWPEDGPQLLWSYEGLGAGHGSVSVAGDQIFVLGMPDTLGVIYSFDMDVFVHKFLYNNLLAQ